jgi:hypothetical protein
LTQPAKFRGSPAQTAFVTANRTFRLPTAPERITRQGSLIRMRTYDHIVTAHLKGA